MLKQITVEKVGAIADLAREASAAHDRLLDKMRVMDQNDDKAEVVERLAGMEGVQDGRLDRLREEIESLTPAQRSELLAVMLVGRGDFTAGEWDTALTEASGVGDTASAVRMADTVQLHPYLTKGLAQLQRL